jgi:hypothetical protein
MNWIEIGLTIFTSGTYWVATRLLSPNPKTEKLKPAQLNEFQVPRSQEGDPVPLIYGTVRLKAPNTLWYGDYSSEPIKTKVSTGIFSSKSVTKGFKYRLGLQLGLCIGTGTIRLRRIWAGRFEAWSGDQGTDGDITIDEPKLFGGDDKGGGLEGTVSFYTGGFSQAQDAYLVDKIDNVDLPRYGGFCHVVFKDFYFGTSPALPALHFELQYTSDQLLTGHGTMPNGWDANPMEILYDLMTSPWARLGMDPSLIDLPSWQAAANTLYDEELGLSLIVGSTNTGKDLVSQLLQHIDGILYHDQGTGLIVAKLIRADYDEDTIPTLNQANVKEIKAMSKTTWDASLNQVRIVYPSREKGYVDTVMVAQDQANVAFQSRVKSVTYSMPACTDQVTAAIIATRSLAQASVPLFKVSLTCNRSLSSLRPGDVFKFVWPPIGLTSMLMRVQNVDLGELADGTITIEAIQDKFAVAKTLWGAPAESGWTAINKTAAPVDDRIVFEAPPFIILASGQVLNHARIYAVAKPPTGNSVAFTAVTSKTSFVSIEEALRNAPYTPFAKLDETMSDADDDGLIADLDIKDVSDPSILQDNAALADIRDGRSLLLIGDEFLIYRSFTDNGGGSYTLHDVYRGVLDSDMQAHAVDDFVWFVQGQDGLFDTAYDFGISTPEQVKLLDVTHDNVLGISAANTDTLSDGARYFKPAPPDHTTIAGLRSGSFSRAGDPNILVEWRERDKHADTIRVIDDPTDTPEAGVKYRLSWRFGSGTWTTVTGITTPSYTIVDGALTTGDLQVEVDSYFDTGPLYSQSKDRVHVTATA